MTSRFFNIIITSLIAVKLFSSCSPEKQPEFQHNNVLDLVDPLIGTDGHGHTTPAATLPFGMVQVGITNYYKGWDWCSGYHYSDSVTQGFAHTHLSGTGLTGMGDILLMPTSGKLHLSPGNDENPDGGYSSRWSHQTEHSSPGFYAVTLDDYEIDVALTATPRVGFHKYMFNTSGTHHVIIDPTHVIGEKLIGSEVEIISDNGIRGYKRCEGAGGNRHVYFYAQFSKSFTNSGVAVDRKLIDGNSASGKEVNAFVSFDTKSDETIIVKVAISFVDYEGAKKNFEAEAEGKSFEETVTTARATWLAHIGKIQIEDDRADLAKKRSFYTGLYHAMLQPNTINDVDNRYVVEGKIIQGSIPQFSTFSTWDTYRAQQPLLTLLNPKKSSEIVNSLISRHHEAKVDLPIWELAGHDNACMMGYSPVSVIVDAVRKGVPGIDPKAAFEAIKSVSLNPDKKSMYANDAILPWLDKLNYVPANVAESCSENMEHAYLDWCIYMLAKDLGLPDTTVYKKRSQSYLNLFREDIGYIAPKDENGNWVDIDLHNWNSIKPHYITGNIWGYTTMVLHDIDRLIELKGGNEKFCLWLDDILADTAALEGESHVDISGFTGRYAHGDEPSHQIPYLYNYAGQPWKTQALVGHVIKTFYTDKPNGYCNNEDSGQMASWYVMGSLGFYSFCPGSNSYTLTTPGFQKITIDLDNGKKLKIECNKNPESNNYIKALTLDNNLHSDHLISHKQLTNGMKLEFELDSTPNKSWAIQK